jgi:hypothetical protein
MFDAKKWFNEHIESIKQKKCQDCGISYADADILETVREEGDGTNYYGPCGHLLYCRFSEESNEQFFKEIRQLDKESKN